MRFVVRIPVEIYREDKPLLGGRSTDDSLTFYVEAPSDVEAKLDAEAKLRGLMDLMHTWRASR